MAEADWASLPSDLLGQVLQKLMLVTDYIQFGAVCKNWQSTALQQKQKRIVSCHKQPPMLMGLNYNTSKAWSTKPLFFTFTQGGKMRQLMNFKPKTMNKLQTCTHGWLAYCDDKSVMELLNPFTRHTINLPPLIGGWDSVKWVVLSADPCLFPNNYEVLVSHYGDLRHMKSGDDSWTQIGDELLARKVIDAVYYKGQFFVRVSSDIYGELNFPTNVTISFVPSHDDVAHNLCSDFMLKSSTGEDLFLVIAEYKIIRIYVDGDYDPDKIRDTEKINVYKLSLGAGGDAKHKWIENAAGIGTDVLFMGACPKWEAIGETKCVSTLEYPEYPANSIYLGDGGFFKFRDGSFFKLESRGIDNKHNFIVPYMRSEMSARWISPTLAP